MATPTSLFESMERAVRAYRHVLVPSLAIHAELSRWHEQLRASFLVPANALEVARKEVAASVSAASQFRAIAEQVTGPQLSAAAAFEEVRKQFDDLP